MKASVNAQIRNIDYAQSMARDDMKLMSRAASQRCRVIGMPANDFSEMPYQMAGRREFSTDMMISRRKRPRRSGISGLAH